jgi:hypothetical protein
MAGQIVETDASSCMDRLGHVSFNTPRNTPPYF